MKKYYNKRKLKENLLDYLINCVEELENPAVNK